MTITEAVEGLSGHVLVAMDFDGTLSEIIDVPSESKPVPGALEALETLHNRSDTTVAVVSGRDIGELVELLALPDAVIRVGEHGAAWHGVEVSAPVGFRQVHSALVEVADRFDGAWVEVKQASLVLHSRLVAPERESELVDAAGAALEALGHANFHTGRNIVDVGFVDTDKGQAVETIRERCHADVVVFAGDDTTDETVFEAMRPADIGIKVGSGPSAAQFRVEGPSDVVEVLRMLARR
jgi:trehalose 6-phosphate phosphatase